jgi:hypothetical protein
VRQWCGGDDAGRGQQAHDAAEVGQLGGWKGQRGDQLGERGCAAQAVDGGRDAELDDALERHGRHVVEAVAPKVGLRLQKLGVGGNRQLWLGRHWFDCSLWITLTLAMGYGYVRCVYMVLLAIANCVCVGQVLLTSNIYPEILWAGVCQTDVLGTCTRRQEVAVRLVG